MRIKRKLFDILDDQPENGGWLGRLLHYGILCLIIINIIAMTLETVPALEKQYHNIFFLIELISVHIFAIEFMIRLWVITEDRSGRFKHPLLGRLHYIVTPLAIVDLLAFLPFYLAPYIGLDLRILRIFRLLRMIKLLRYSPALSTLGRVYWAERKSVSAAIIVMLTLMIVSSTLMWTLEHQVQPEAFESIPDAMWWAMATLTTVGYGDMSPITAGGRILGGVVMLLGIGMFTLPAAILAAGFAQEIKRSDFIISFDSMANIPVFQNLKAKQIAALTKTLHTRIFPQDYLILSKDEQPKALYIILEGEIKMTLPEGENILGPGEFFGALAEFGIEEAYQAHIQTNTDARLLLLDLDDFNHLMTQMPELREAIINSKKAVT